MSAPTLREIHQLAELVKAARDRAKAADETTMADPIVAGVVCDLAEAVGHLADAVEKLTVIVASRA